MEYRPQVEKLIRHFEAVQYDTPEPPSPRRAAITADAVAPDPLAAVLPRYGSRRAVLVAAAMRGGDAIV